MGNIPKWKIPPNPDIPYEKSKADWADYWFEAIRHGEDFIATPEGCYESKTAITTALIWKSEYVLYIVNRCYTRCAYLAYCD